MRIISFTCLHYGSDYLKYALQSVHDAVDAQYVLYTSQGSHGHRTNAVCPDTREQLATLAIEGAGSKLRWVEKDFDNEGQQRDYIHVLEPNADCIVVVDSDEVYADGLVKEAINVTKTWHRRYIRLPFIHLWRSFNRGFAHDPALPSRIIYPQVKEGAETYNTKSAIWHFGYAQSSAIVQYKQLTHGHKAEWRRDVDWFTDVFVANRQTDCHPVGSEYWNAEDMDLSQLPSVLNDHPYRNLDLIP